VSWRGVPIAASSSVKGERLEKQRSAAALEET